MLVPFQLTGDLPPFFMLHGVFGLYSGDPWLVRCVGPGRPVYGVNAPGYHGEPICTSAEEMAEVYATEIIRERGMGPHLVGAYCEGGKVAVELARQLQARGCEVGPVLLVDPGTMPYRNPAALEKFEASALDPKTLAAWRSFAAQALKAIALMMPQIPFALADAVKFDAATTVAAETKTLITRFVPKPYSGPMELILSAARAPGFFEPGHDWQRLLTGPRVVHVLDGSHKELINEKPAQVKRLIAAFLESHRRASPR